MYRSRPKPNGCSSVASRFDRLPPISSRAWLPESATEWIDSASMDENPVSRNAMNFVIAMPMFARSAAMTALVPPSALIWPPIPHGQARGRCPQQPDPCRDCSQGPRLVDEHHRDVSADRVGQLTGAAHELLGVVVDEQGGPALRAHQDVEQGGVEVHARILARTSSRTRAIVGSSAPSTLSRSRGSVFDGRTLNHQSSAVTVRPSRRSRS